MSVKEIIDQMNDLALKIREEGEGPDLMCLPKSELRKIYNKDPKGIREDLLKILNDETIPENYPIMVSRDSSEPYVESEE